MLGRTLPTELSEALDRLEAARAAIQPASDRSAECHRAYRAAHAAESAVLYELSRARISLRAAEAGFIEGSEAMGTVDTADVAVRMATERAAQASDAIARAANLLGAAEARLQKLRGEHWQARRVAMKLVQEFFETSNPRWGTNEDVLQRRGEALGRLVHLIQQDHPHGATLLRHFLSGTPFRTSVRRSFFYMPGEPPFLEGQSLNIPLDLTLLHAVDQLHLGRLALVTQ